MQKGWIISFLGLCASVLAAVHTAWALELISQDVVEKEIIKKVDLIKNADNFLIFFDGSSPTNSNVPGTQIPKILAAKKLLQERNKWMPDLGYTSGLYLLSGWKTLKTIQGTQRYDRAAFASAIEQLPDKGEGNSLLQQVLLELDTMLAKLSGRTAVILFTDGTFTKTSYPKKPVEIAKDLAQKYNVRFYVISSADTYSQKEIVKGVGSINAGSRVIPIQAFLRYPEYLSGALFAVKVSSYERLKTVQKTVGFTTEDLLFDYNSHAIRSEYNPKLDTLGRFLQDNPNVYAVIQGHTDGIGSEEYNMSLSRARAEAVAGFLYQNYKIDSERIVPLWFGMMNPAADNTTDQGRQLNRRVEIAVGGMQ